VLRVGTSDRRSLRIGRPPREGAVLRTDAWDGSWHVKSSDWVRHVQDVAHVGSPGQVRWTRNRRRPSFADRGGRTTTQFPLGPSQAHARDGVGRGGSEDGQVRREAHSRVLGFALVPSCGGRRRWEGILPFSRSSRWVEPGFTSLSHDPPTQGRFLSIGREGKGMPSFHPMGHPRRGPPLRATRRIGEDLPDRWEMEQNHAQVEQLENERKQIQIRIRVLEDLRRDADTELARVECALALAKERRKRHREQQEQQQKDREQVRQTVQRWETEMVGACDLQREKMLNRRQGRGPWEPTDGPGQGPLQDTPLPDGPPRDNQACNGTHYERYRGSKLEDIPQNPSLLGPLSKAQHTPLDAMRCNCTWLDPFRPMCTEEICEKTCRLVPCPDRPLQASWRGPRNDGRKFREDIPVRTGAPHPGPHKRMKVVANLQPRSQKSKGAGAVGLEEKNAWSRHNPSHGESRGKAEKDKKQGTRYFRGDIFDPLARPQE